MTQEPIHKSRGSVSTQGTISCDGRSGDFTYESPKTLHEARSASDWCQNLASGITFQRMLTELLHDPPNGRKTSLSIPNHILSNRTSGAARLLPTLPTLSYSAIIAHTPHSTTPGSRFSPYPKATLGEGDPGSRILVVLREQWDRIRHPTGLIIEEHTLQQSKRSRSRSPTKEVHPPWEIVVAVVEFGREELPATLSPPVLAPMYEDTWDERGRKRSRPIYKDLSSLPPSKARKVGSSSSRLELSPQKQQEYSPVEEFLTRSSPRTSVDENHLHSPVQPDPEAGLLGCFHQHLTGVTYRGWASGAIIEARQISLVSCDRGGLVRSSPADMRSPEGFQLLCDWVLTLGSRTMEQWGFINLFGDVGKPVRDAEIDVPLTNLHLSSGDTNIDGVCKIAWPLSSRPNEHELLEKFHAVDPIHTPIVHCGWDIPMELPSKRLRPYCTDASPIKDRTMRVTVMTKYQPIDNLEGDDFLAAFTQIMQCNVRLYEAGCVHHRDLSPSNMMYHRDVAGRVIGVLTDFDLAVPLDGSMQDKVPQKLHGTAPFMPQALQRGGTSEYTLTHDFESALYILAWVAMGYKCGKPSLNVGDPLRRWREGSWEDIAESKLRFLHGEGLYPKVVKEIRPEYKCLLKPIQALRTEVIVDRYTKILYQCLDPGVPPFRPPFGPSQFFEHLDAK